MKKLILAALLLSWQAFGQQTFGNATLYGGNVQSNPGVVNGGYLRFSVVSYNPYDSGSVCFDKWGNPVQQPVPTAGAPPFQTNDLLLWSSLSPSMPFFPGPGVLPGLVQDVLITNTPSTGPGPCGIPLTVNQLYGLNTNGYFFARAGLSTDSPVYNSIQSLQGGIVANSFTAGVLYPAGTVTACCGSLAAPAYLGGHVDLGHSSADPAAGGIDVSQNPFSYGEGLVAGMAFVRDDLACLRVYIGTSFVCVGGGGGSGSPGGPQNAVQFNNPSGTFAGLSTFTFQSAVGAGSGVLSVCATLGGICTATSGVDAQVFSSSATGTATGYTNGSGSFNIQGNGNGNFQVVAATAPNSSSAAIYGKVGFVQSDIGFLALPGTATRYNAFQAPAGGMQALSFSAVNYVQTGNSSGTPTPTTSDSFHAGAMNYNISSSCEEVFDGASWSCIGAGGGGSPGGILTDVQINGGGGTFAGTGNLTFAGQTLTSTAASSGSAAIYGKTGFIQSDQGFIALGGTATAFNAVQAPGGGMEALSFSAVKYLQSGNSSGVPAPTTADSFHAGAMYYDTIAGCEEVFSGASWGCLSGGGGSGVAPPTNSIQYNSGTGFAGSTNLMWDNATAIMTVGGGSGSGIKAPVFSAQNTGTFANFTNNAGTFSIQGNGNGNFQNATVTSSFTSLATGGTPAVTQGSGTFLIAGNGNANFQIIAGTTYNVFATTVIDGSRNLFANNASVAATLNVGTHGGSATSGGGAAISNSTNNVAMLTYDTGGVCGIGTGEPSPGIACVSDARLKKNRKDLGNTLDQIMALRPVTYNWIANNGRGVGFISQEVRTVIPNLVTEMDDPQKTLILSQDGMIPYIVSAMQTMQREISELKKKANIK